MPVKINNTFLHFIFNCTFFEKRRKTAEKVKSVQLIQLTFFKIKYFPLTNIYLILFRHFLWLDGVSTITNSGVKMCHFYQLINIWGFEHGIELQKFILTSFFPGLNYGCNVTGRIIKTPFFRTFIQDLHIILKLSSFFNYGVYLLI